MIGFFNEVDPGKSGGKGRNLIELAKASFPVPPGFILTSDVYSQYRAKGKIPEKLKKIISAYYQKLCRNSGSNFTAVRSSASAEDMETVSFAGQYETYLYVSSEDELFKRIIACWNSLFSERAAAYRQRMNIPGKKENLKMAVIVQTMIDAKAAGVLFTSSPHPGKSSGKEKVMIVEANWGCGETVVSGKVTPDLFIVAKNEHGPVKILQKIPGKKEIFLQGSAAGPVEKNTPAGQRNKFSLTDEELIRLCETGVKIEDHFGSARDIEWAVSKDNNLYILQSRPLTKE